MKYDKIGYGFGTRDPGPLPNALRVFSGEAESSSSEDEVVVLETTVDDMSGEVAGYLFDSLLKAGALDVMTIPVGMKKSRPGTLIVVIGRPEDERWLVETMLRETTTFGVRVRRDRRVILERRTEQVDTPWGKVGMKIGRLGGEDLQAAPEFEDCKAVAESSGVSLRKVQQAAIEAHRKMPGRST